MKIGEYKDLVFDQELNILRTKDFKQALPLFNLGDHVDLELICKTWNTDEDVRNLGADMFMVIEHSMSDDQALILDNFLNLIYQEEEGLLNG